MGDRKGIRIVKTSASELFGMAVNVTGLGTTIWVPFVPYGTKSFSLFCEDAQGKDDWRLRIIGATGCLRLAWKMAIKQYACTYVCFYY